MTVLHHNEGSPDQSSSPDVPPDGACRRSSWPCLCCSTRAHLVEALGCAVLKHGTPEAGVHRCVGSDDGQHGCHVGVDHATALGKAAHTDWHAANLHLQTRLGRLSRLPEGILSLPTSNCPLGLVNDQSLTCRLTTGGRGLSPPADTIREAESVAQGDHASACGKYAHADWHAASDVYLQPQQGRLSCCRVMSLPLSELPTRATQPAKNTGES